METPTPTLVRARSPLLTQRYPAPVDPAPESEELLAVIGDAAALVGGATGRLIAPLTEGEEVPEGLVGIAVRAVARWAERVDSAMAVASAGKASGGKLLRSISAGPWSESYFAPGELSMKNGVVAISGDALLDQLLWALMTEERRDEWVALATGVQRPASALIAFDYRQMAGGGGPAIGFGAGPDGW